MIIVLHFEALSVEVLFLYTSSVSARLGHPEPRWSIVS